MKLNVKFRSDDKTMKVGFDQYIGGSSSVEVPTKLSELENDVGYITAEDIPEVEVPTKLSDLEADSISRGDQEPFDFSVYSADFNAHEMNFEVDNINFKNMNYGSGINFDGNVIHGVGAPTDDTDAVNKKYVDDAVSTISWNDLTDKPFGETDVGAWKEVGNGISSETGNLKSFTVNNIISNFEPIVGKKYKIFANFSFGRIIESIGVARKKINPDNSESFVIGSDGDAIVWDKGVKNSVWYITLAEPMVSQMGVGVTIYEAEPAIIILDEKYIPDTIARKSDIPDVPTKISEFENDVGFITADDIPEGGGGVTSWNDLTDKPFREEPEFDIQWNGDMTDRVVLDMSMLGYPQGLYFVKVSNDVFTTEELIGCRYTVTTYVGDNFEYEIYPDIVDVKTYPGAINIADYIIIVHDDNALATALGIPTGIYTNGVYFYLRTEDRYLSSLVSANTITKVDNKHLDMDSIVTDVLNALPIYNGEVEEV